MSIIVHCSHRRPRRAAWRTPGSGPAITHPLCQSTLLPRGRGKVARTPRLAVQAAGASHRDDDLAARGLFQDGAWRRGCFLPDLTSCLTPPPRRYCGRVRRSRSDPGTRICSLGDSPPLGAIQPSVLWPTMTLCLFDAPFCSIPYPIRRISGTSPSLSHCSVGISCWSECRPSPLDHYTAGTR